MKLLFVVIISLSYFFVVTYAASATEPKEPRKNQVIGKWSKIDAERGECNCGECLDI